MQKFSQYLLEKGGGAEAGEYEIISTSVDKAEVILHRICDQYNVNPNERFPNFRKNYIFAQKLAHFGKTKRVDMPVIRRDDVSLLRNRLSKGELDIRKPYSPETNSSNPFPQHLSGKNAEDFLSNGLRDGDKNDDKIKSRQIIKTVGSLKPIQEQIYVDKALTFMRLSQKEFITMLKETSTIVSKDNYILDGHHRWLFAIFVSPDIKMLTTEFNLELNTLLKVLIAYGDVIGNKRNQ